MHGRCAKVERVTAAKKKLHAENVKGILERQWSKKKSYVMKWKQ